MKKLISILLCAVLLLSLAPASLAASSAGSDPEHSDLYNAISDALCEAKVEAVAWDREKNSSEERIGICVYSGDYDLGSWDFMAIDGLENFKTMGIEVYVNEEHNSVRLSVPVIQFDKNISEEDYNSLLKAVNYANGSYGYVTFIADPGNLTVDAEFAAYVREDSAGEVVLDMVKTMARSVDRAYGAVLEPFDTAA